MPLQTLNRSALVVVPKQPFLDWVNSHGAPPLSLDEVQEDSSMYLLPEFDDPDAEAAYLRKSFDKVFQEQLSSWWTGSEDWPQKRTFAMFNDWFSYRTYSMVIDVAGGRLVRENL